MINTPPSCPVPELGPRVLLGVARAASGLAMMLVDDADDSASVEVRLVGGYIIRNEHAYCTMGIR